MSKSVGIFQLSKPICHFPIEKLSRYKAKKVAFTGRRNI